MNPKISLTQFRKNRFLAHFPVQPFLPNLIIAKIIFISIHIVTTVMTMTALRFTSSLVYVINNSNHAKEGYEKKPFSNNSTWTFRTSKSTTIHLCWEREMLSHYLISSIFTFSSSSFCDFYNFILLLLLQKTRIKQFSILCIFDARYTQ